MKNNYKVSGGNGPFGGLLKVSAIIVLIMVWILIDKGNIYGQSIADKGLTVKQTVQVSDQAPLFREGGDDRGGDELPAEDEGDEFVVRPNPVEGDLVFDFEFTVKTAIPYEVMDPLGRVAIQGSFEPGVSTQSIDFSDLKTGMYLVRLDLGHKMKVRRIIKK